MIQIDEHGNRFVVMADGACVPLVDSSATVRIETAENGQIMSVLDALSINRTCAQHWYQRYQEAQTTIADLRAQLAEMGHQGG